MVWLIVIISFGVIVSGILLLKQSAKKFNLTDEQLKEIEQRNQQLDKRDNEENDY